MRGNGAVAASHLDEVEAIVGDPRNEWMTWRYRMHYQLTAAELALSRGEVARAGQLTARCREAAQRTRSRRYLVRAARIWGACHAADGDLQGANAILAAAVQEARELKNPPQLWQTLLAHGRVQQRLGMRDEAIVTWREALALVTAVEQHLPDDVRCVFHTSPISVALHELV
jgi:ATP/maltotriose-dependent transcriptional regulator MalT